MSNYSSKLVENRYVIYDDENILTTLGVNNVTTMYKPLTERIILDPDCFVWPICI